MKRFKDSHNRRWIQGLCLFLPMVFGFAAHAQPEGAACRAVRQACVSAGFGPGQSLKRGCLDPIINGAAQPRRLAKPLPSVSPDLVQQCRGGGADARSAPTNPSVASSTPPTRIVGHTTTPLSALGIILYRENLNDDGQFQQALAVKGVDGMAIVLDWSTIAPTQTAFDTATIDLQVNEARQFNMPVELVIRAGASVPSWVSRGHQLSLFYAPHGGSASSCLPVDMPPPWDSTYQQAFAAFVKRTAEYVSSKGVQIVVVKLTGINSTTEELRLPAEDATATAKCQGATDDVAAWKAAHYTPAKVAQALTQLATSFAAIFPSTPVTLAMIPRNGFPPIDPSQHVVRGQQKASLNASLLQSLVSGAAGAIPGRFILQYDYLNYNQPADSEVVDLAKANNLPLAWQTNLWRGSFQQGAGCGGSPGAGTICHDPEYLGLLEEGVHPAGGSGRSAQGLYIEVFPYDAINHQAVIYQVHDQLLGLLPPPPSPPHPPHCPPGVKCPPPV